MSKQLAYEKWKDSQPQSTAAYSAFLAGWDARGWVELTSSEVDKLLGQMSLGATTEDVRLVEYKLKAKNA
jgi:hypothetical protein